MRKLIEGKIVVSFILLSMFLMSFNWVDRGETTGNTVKIYAPAVSRTAEGYTGAVIEITVSVTNGSGEVYVSTIPLTEVDMQASARTAALIACQLAGEDFNKHDFYVKVNSSSLIVGGPSAGAEMTIAIVSALEGWEINYSVMMTGMINPDETIGPVGGIPEKMEAAAGHGVRVFLIPLGQRYFTKYEVVEDKIGPFIIRRVKPVSIDIYEEGRKLNVVVKEIGDVREAIMYFTGHYIPVGNYSEPPKPRKDISMSFKEQFKDLRLTAENMIRRGKQLISKVNQLYRSDLENILSEAEELLGRADGYASKGNLYSASSLAFQSLVRAQEAEFLGRAVGGESIDGMVEEVKGVIREAGERINSTVISSVNEFELMIAANWRLSDANKALNEAATYYSKGDVESAISSLAYAKWRAETALQWMEMTSTLEKGKGVDWEKTKSILNNYLYEAETVISYTQTVLGEMGYTPAEIQEAVAYLEKAKENYNKGNLILAFGESIHALVYASTAMSLIPTSEYSINYQVEYARKKSLNSLWKSKNGGAESILGYAYFEFAETSNKQPVKLLHYKLSSAYSTTLQSVTGGEVKPIPITVKPTLTPSPAETPSPTQQPQGKPGGKQGFPVNLVVTLLIVFTIGLVVGIALTRKR